MIVDYIITAFGMYILVAPLAIIAYSLFKARQSSLVVEKEMERRKKQRVKKNKAKGAKK